MKEYTIKNNTMEESELQRVYIYEIYPRDSKIYSDRGFVQKVNGSLVCSSLVCFIVKDNKSYYLIASEELQINFYLNNYLNQYYIIIVKYKIYTQNFVEAIAYSFSIYLKE